MSRTLDLSWAAEPGAPVAAAPLRAVDAWFADCATDRLSLSIRVRVDGDDPNLRGHFPGLPIFPGVFVVEALCQAMALAGPAVGTGRLVVHTLRSVRFFAPMFAGDELRLDVTGAPDGVDGWLVRAEGRRRDGQTAARIRAGFRPAGAGDA